MVTRTVNLTGSSESAYVAGSSSINGVKDGIDFIVNAGAGNDTVTGYNGTDTSYFGDDTLNGEAGNDSLLGGAGNDSLNGGADNDTLNGGAGSDILTGGTGFDRFIASEGTERDTITDFSTAGAGDKNAANNDFVDLSQYYNPTTLAAYNAGKPVAQQYKSPIEWLRADQADGVLTQGNYTDSNGVKHVVNLAINNNGKAVQSQSLTQDNTNVVCFTPGTMIAVEGGVRPVETLKAGDLVMTRDRGLQPVRWIGTREVSGAELALDPALRPIRINAGALGHGLPQSDLLVSPMHRMVVASDLIKAETGEAEVLIAARNLVDLPGVDVAEVPDVVYIHFMCDRHEIVIANGAASETLNVGQHTAAHLSPSAYIEITSLFPELATQTGTPVRRPLPGDWGRDVARRHAAEGLPLAV